MIIIPVRVPGVSEMISGYTKSKGFSETQKVDKEEVAAIMVQLKQLLSSAGGLDLAKISGDDSLLPGGAVRAVPMEVAKVALTASRLALATAIEKIRGSPQGPVELCGKPDSDDEGGGPPPDLTLSDCKDFAKKACKYILGSVDKKASVDTGMTEMVRHFGKRSG